MSDITNNNITARMKFILCAVFVALASSALGANNEISFVSPTLGRVIAGATENRIFEDTFLEILECFRTVLSAGLPEHGIPSFSPLEMPELKIDLDALGIEGGIGFINFENLVLDGIMGFDPTHIKINAIVVGGLGAEIQVTLMFDNINFKSDYEADLKVFDIPVEGQGDVKLDITNLQFEVVLRVRLTAPEPSERIYLESMKFLPSVDNVHIEFTGLFNDPVHNDQVNEILNSILTNWVNEKAQDISDIIEKILKIIINSAQNGETDEFKEDPNLIEIILNECKDDITTPETTTIATTTTIAPPANDCENPSGIIQTTICDLVKAIEDLQIVLQEYDPLVDYDWKINMETIGIGKGIWTLNKVELSSYSNFLLEKINVKTAAWPGWGLAAEVTIPIFWKSIELDITQNGDIELLGMKIKGDNSRFIGFIRNFKLSIYVVVAIMNEPIQIINIGLKPTIPENDITGACSGIYVNGEDISNMLTNFINNDLGKFLAKHGEDIGDIISAIIMKIISGNLLPAEDPFAAQVLKISEKLTTALQQNFEDLNL